MSAAMKGASARTTMRAPEMKTQSPSGSRGRAGVRISNLPPWLSLLCVVIYIKEEPAMQISVSSTLTVYHDGQFRVGLAEHVEDADTAPPASSSARSRPMRRSCDSLQANGNSRSSETSLRRRASLRGNPNAAPERRRRPSGDRRWAPSRSRRSRVSGRQ